MQSHFYRWLFYLGKNGLSSGAFKIVASIKVPQRFNVERSVANVAAQRFVAG
jgi:hypothetical protein